MGLPSHFLEKKFVKDEKGDDITPFVILSHKLKKCTLCSLNKTQKRTDLPGSLNCWADHQQSWAQWWSG
jgi:hypothetical protein